MQISVVIRTKDEADRLRLTLHSLAHQKHAAEIIVVDDGSSDHTAAVLDEARHALTLTVRRHETAQGRSAAANAGAAVASGDILVFLDGDTLAAPNFVAGHAEAHQTADGRVARGETYHLRGTRFLLDPERGTARPGEEERVARLDPRELARLLVTRQDLEDNFEVVDRRAQPGVYPGAGPRKLYEIEMEALHEHPDCGVLWAAASGANMSMRRTDFLQVGGFHPELDINEHRELALKLCQRGARMVPVPARSYHLTHRSGWRDPIQDTRWEALFCELHPIPAVRLLTVFWASLSDSSPVPADQRITSLPALELAAAGTTGIDYEAVRRLIPGLTRPAERTVPA
jgi:GT2 family glycosyltransferase